MRPLLQENTQGEDFRAPAPAPEVRGGRGRGRRRRGLTEESTALEEDLAADQNASDRPEPEPEITIDLTDSPSASPVVSQSRRPSQSRSPIAPPALHCPVCLDTFSAIRRRGSHYQCPPPLSPPSYVFNLLSGIQLMSTVCGHVFCRSCLRQCVLTLHQCPTCRRRISLQDYHPLFL